MARRRESRIKIEKTFASLGDAPSVFEGFVPILPLRQEFAGWEDIKAAHEKSNRGEKLRVPYDTAYKRNLNELRGALREAYGERKPMTGEVIVNITLVVPEKSREQHALHHAGQTILAACWFDLFTADDRPLGVILSGENVIDLNLKKRTAAEGEECGFWFCFSPREVASEPTSDVIAAWDATIAECEARRAALNAEMTARLARLDAEQDEQDDARVEAGEKEGEMTAKNEQVPTMTLEEMRSIPTDGTFVPTMLDHLDRGGELPSGIVVHGERAGGPLPENDPFEEDEEPTDSAAVAMRAIDALIDVADRIVSIVK